MAGPGETFVYLPLSGGWQPMTNAHLARMMADHVAGNIPAGRADMEQGLTWRKNRVRGCLSRTMLLSALTFAVFARAEVSSARDLQIYFIDVEGGQSTLIITPDRHSLLIDAGWAGDGSGFRPGDPHTARDANRILAAALDAGIRRIDYLLITHFHPDHDGGTKELSQLIPIQVFIDHGSPNPEAESASPETQD